MAASKTKLTAVDLFAGAGGFSLAAQQADFRVLAAVELDKHACSTYRRNFIKGKRGNVPRLYEQDILELNPEQILKDLRIKPGELDVLMGGPPCQGFSTHRINDAGVDDPRNKLLLRYFAFVNTLRPKIFVVENVPGLLWPRHKKHLDKFYQLAAKNGYKAHDPQLINAKDFGVPQNRKRVFILGVRSDIALPDDFEWPPKPTHFNPRAKEVLEDGRPAWVSAQTVFEKPLLPDDINNKHMNPSSGMLERFKQTKKNGGSRSDWKTPLVCHKKHDGHKDVYGRIDPKKPGPTMTTGCINPSKGRFVHPTEHHGITARHAARFQTFPENFYFEGGLGSAGKQVGNAVPVELGRRILATYHMVSGGSR